MTTVTLNMIVINKLLQCSFNRNK